MTSFWFTLVWQERQTPPPLQIVWLFFFPWVGVWRRELSHFHLRLLLSPQPRFPSTTGLRGKKIKAYNSTCLKCTIFCWCFSDFKVNYTQLQSVKTTDCLWQPVPQTACKTACSRFTKNSLLSKLKLEKRISEIITSKKAFPPILLLWCGV